MTDPKYPHIEVDLVGEDGNAFAIIARVQRALRQAGVHSDEIHAFIAEAMDGDYSHMLRVVQKTVEVV